MLIKNAEFITSVAGTDKIFATGKPEIAIAGKSNVGKSSFINFITNNGKLARTSRTPGRTRLLNFFEVNHEWYIVDLPGYGYARVNDGEKKNWQELIEAYLCSPDLRNVFLLLDIRHLPTEEDKTLINYLNFHRIPFTLIATKSDKLSRQQINKAINDIASDLKVGTGDIIPVSSLNKTGLSDIERRISHIL